MNKNAIQKRFIQLQGEVEHISYHISRSRQLMQDGGFSEYRESTGEASRLLEKAAVQMRELILETAFVTKEQLMDGITGIHGITVEFTGGWYKIVIPVLLTSKHSGRSCSFIENPLRYAIGRFVKEYEPQRTRECVICFRHIYRSDFPERAVRDHDNIEVKKVQDVIADKLLVDDTGLYCSNLNITLTGEKDSTEVYVIPVEMFPEWLKKHPIKKP